VIASTNNNTTVSTTQHNLPAANTVS